MERLQNLSPYVSTGVYDIVSGVDDLVADQKNYFVGDTRGGFGFLGSTPAGVYIMLMFVHAHARGAPSIPLVREGVQWMWTNVPDAQELRGYVMSNKLGMRQLYQATVGAVVTQRDENVDVWTFQRP